MTGDLSLRMAVGVTVNGCHNAPLPIVSAASPSAVWDAMGEEGHAAALRGRTCLCSIQQWAAGEDWRGGDLGKDWGSKLEQK